MGWYYSNWNAREDQIYFYTISFTTEQWKPTYLVLQSCPYFQSLKCVGLMGHGTYSDSFFWLLDWFSGKYRVFLCSNKVLHVLCLPLTFRVKKILAPQWNTSISLNTKAKFQWNMSSTEISSGCNKVQDFFFPEEKSGFSGSGPSWHGSWVWAAACALQV